MNFSHASSLPDWSGGHPAIKNQENIHMKQQVLFDQLLTELSENLSILPDKSEETPENTLRALWLLSGGKHFSPILAANMELPELNEIQQEELVTLVANRISGIPLAHLTERQHFQGLDYLLSKGLYIPRHETELLAQTAIDTIHNEFSETPALRLIDLCCGIGTVALAVAHYCPNTAVLGSDIYAPAIEAAKLNITHFELNERARFFYGDLFDPFNPLEMKESIHFIVSAPPYISTVKVEQMESEISQHEPREAFDAGPFGLTIFNKLITESPDYLCSGGYLIFECGLGQADFLYTRLNKNGAYNKVEIINDESGNGRVLKARKA